MYCCQAEVTSESEVSVSNIRTQERAREEAESRVGGGEELGLTLVIRLPLHPPLKDLPRPCDVLKELLEVDEFEPHLVDSREEGDGSVVKVPGMLDVSSFELLLERRAGSRG
jgi:hypothetical protein